MELREEPSKSSIYPAKPMAFASYDDEPPSYVNDLPHRARDQYPRTRARDDNWGNPSAVPLVYTPTSNRGLDFDSGIPSPERPLRPNRRDDLELGGDTRPPISQVSLPTTNRPARKSSGGKSAKNWLRNIRSPIGKLRLYDPLAY